MIEPRSATFERMEEFRQRVLNDPALLARLRATDGGSEFIQYCIAVAREMGIELSGDEMESALGAARRELIERWV